MSYIEKRNKIDSLQEKINSYGDLKEDVKKKINYKFRLDWNFYSNSMEGNTLTMDETRSVMVGNITVGGKPIKDILEMKGHDHVIEEILKIGKGNARISEKRVIDIHKGIMHEEDVKLKAKIGKWKTEPNYIYNYKGERFDFVPPQEVPERMHDLLNKTNALIDNIEHHKPNSAHPIDIALQFHLEYVLIHPFYDGNGRTARILTNLLLISFGYPPFWVKSNDRKTYNQYIGDIQGYGGEPELFYEFVADNIIHSQQIILNAIEGKDISENDDLDKEISLLKSQLSGDNVLETLSSSDTICDTIEFNLIPLFIFIENKMNELKDFFFEMERQVSYKENTDAFPMMIFNGSFSMDTLKQNWLNNTIRNQKRKIESLQYSYVLKGFKKNVNGQTLSVQIDFYFNEYNYTIQTNQLENRSQSKPYNQTFSPEEIQSIATPLIKHTLESIKLLTEKNK